MRRFLKIFVLVMAVSALCALGYTRFIRPKIAPPDARVGLTRLSEMIDTHIDLIFAPLTTDRAPIPAHELRKLREQFVDAAKAGSNAERRVYSSASKVCDALLVAAQERERDALALADTRSKAYATGLSGNAQKEAMDKAQFFEFGVTRRWAESAKEHRAKVTRLYSDLREEERSQGVLPKPSR